MAGHSKWANIKRTKAKVDAARGATFTKLAREIIIASKLGGPDPDGNYRLRTAVAKAKQAGMPADNIKRAIAKGQGGGGEENVEEIQYEGYGPGGVAVLVQAMTDNRNRTASDVRHFFSKYGGNLGETGCVGWMFAPKGQIRIVGEALDFDSVFLTAADAGAEDVRQGDEGIEVITGPDDLEAVHKALSAAGYEVESADLVQMPNNTVEVTDPDLAKKLLKLLDALESHDDVQQVYCNFDMADELVESAAV